MYCEYVYGNAGKRHLVAILRSNVLQRFEIRPQPTLSSYDQFNICVSTNVDDLGFAIANMAPTLG